MTESGAVSYERVDIDYQRRDSQERFVSFRNRDIRLVGEPDPTATPPEPGDWTVDNLKVKFPVGTSQPNLAQAILTIHQKRSTDSAQPPKSVRMTLDFPKQQLDLLLVDLARSGFFDDQSRPDGGVQLTVAIDRGHGAKAWTREARLDDLADRVYHEGEVLPVEQDAATQSRSWLDFLKRNR